jgi:transposase-like protein
MARYSEEFKYSIMMKMMPPQNQSISQVARETGLSDIVPLVGKWI